VKRWIDRCNEEDDLTTHRPGRPRVLSEENIQQIRHMAANRPFINSVIITEELEINCGLDTVRSALKSGGLYCRKPAKKIRLSPE
jgi:transposase